VVADPRLDACRVAGRCLISSCVDTNEPGGSGFGRGRSWRLRVVMQYMASRLCLGPTTASAILITASSVQGCLLCRSDRYRRGCSPRAPFCFSRVRLFSAFPPWRNLSWRPRWLDLGVFLAVVPARDAVPLESFSRLGALVRANRGKRTPYGYRPSRDELENRDEDLIWSFCRLLPWRSHCSGSILILALAYLFRCDHRTSAASAIAVNVSSLRRAGLSV